MERERKTLFSPEILRVFHNGQRTENATFSVNFTRILQLTENGKHRMFCFHALFQ